MGTAWHAPTEGRSSATPKKGRDRQSLAALAQLQSSWVSTFCEVDLTMYSSALCASLDDLSNTHQL